MRRPLFTHPVRFLAVTASLALLPLGAAALSKEPAAAKPDAKAAAQAPAAPAAKSPAGTTAAPPVPAPSGDTREAIVLTPSERARMLEGMRLYLQALQGVVEQLAQNQLDGVAQYAHEAGAKMLQDAPMSIPLKAPIQFTTLSLQTHEKFDVLADRARAASRGEVLTALAEIMANCTSCHATYRVVP